MLRSFKRRREIAWAFARFRLSGKDPTRKDPVTKRFRHDLVRG